MDSEQVRVSEAVQKLAVKMLAVNPAGEGLCLIGGYRYRLLDASCRRSLDIDYHWDGSLEKKQAEVVTLFRKKLLPLIRERMGYDGSVSPATGPDAESSAVKTVELAVWQKKGSLGRITIPVDITRIPCADKPIARTVDGVVYLSASDADMVESKLISIVARPYLEDRDIMDVFLFQDKLVADSAKRVSRKFAQLRLTRNHVLPLLKKLEADRDYHIRNLDGIVKTQIDPPAAANIREAGGAAMIFDRAMELMKVICIFKKERRR
jgi:hypothetical protein